MFIVLDVSYSLGKVAVGADSRSVEAILDLTEELFNHWNSILTDNNTFHFLWLDLAVPLMVSDVIDCKSFDGISI